MAAVKLQFNSAEVERIIGNAAGDTLAPRAEEAAAEMVKDANRRMESDYNLNRPYERRRWPGSRRAATALDFFVDRESNGDISWGFKVLGGDEVLKRILILSYGSRPHKILPSGAWPLKGARIFSRASRSQGTTFEFAQDKLAWTDEETGQQVVTDEVDHPGTKGTGFLEDALRASVDRFTST